MFARPRGRHPDLSDFRPSRRESALLLIVVVPVWLGSALEELVYSGYFMNRVAVSAVSLPPPGSQPGPRLCLSSVCHEESQGITGMLQEGFAAAARLLLPGSVAR